MKKRLLCLLVVVVLCLVISLAALAAQLPKMIKVATSSLGSGTYAKAVIFTGVIKGATNIDVRIMPIDTQIGVALEMRSNVMDCAYYTSTGMFFLAHGLDVFGTSEWGPQPVRGTLMGMGGVGWAVAANSDIKEWADMKGKKVAITPGAPLTTTATLAFLAFGGITSDDVERVVVSGTSGAYNALIDGTLDGAYMPFVGASSYTMEGSPRGLRWLLMDPDNDEGWKRLQKLMPYGPFLSKNGAGCSEEKPIQGAGYNMGFFSYKDANPDITYIISKAIYEGYDSYKDVSADLKYWDQKLLLSYENQIMPIHDGTVKFLKDIGKWTPEMEKWQAWKVKQETGRLEGWPKVVQMAKDKNIQVGSEEFRAMWLEFLGQNELISTTGKAPTEDLK